MASTLSRGTLFPAELRDGMINLVKGKSSLARLSAAEPIGFNGTEFFTFSLDNDVSVVGENEAKANGGATVAPVIVRPYKFEYGFRTSDEFMTASEEYRLNVLSQFVDAGAKKFARGFDIAAFHGFNPRTKTASTVIGTNHFDSQVTQTTTFAAATADANVEAAIALVQGNEEDVTGMAMAPAFRSALAALTKTSGDKKFPELAWGAQPGVINGLSVDTNSTVSINSNADRAIVGNFQDYFKWGFAKDMYVKVIEYGNPDNDSVAGDLQGHNQLYLRLEAYIGWGILNPNAFARIIASGT